MGSTDREINKKRRLNSPDLQIPGKFSSDHHGLQDDDPSRTLSLSLASFCSAPHTVSLMNHHRPPTPRPPLPADLTTPALSLQLSQPNQQTETGENPYRYYQEVGPINGAPASRLPQPQLGLHLSPPHHTLPENGENPKKPSVSALGSVTLPSYFHYQENGPPQPALQTSPASLDLPPQFANSNALPPVQFSPFHHSLTVTGSGIPSLHQEVGPSNNAGPVAPAKPPRVRRNPSQAPREGKSDTVPAPFPWATNHRATVHTLSYILSKQIFSITGEVQCKRCEKKYEMEFDLQQKFSEIARFIVENKASMHDRAPGNWLNPVLPTCKFCQQENSAKPITSNKKKSINWLFLLLGQMLGCCTLDQLKYFCKHTKNHRTGAKDRVLYLTYLGLCKQLDPRGPFEYR